MEDFRILSDEEFERLSQADKRAYNRKKSDYESQMRIDSIMSSAEDNVTSSPSQKASDTQIDIPRIHEEIINTPVSEVKEESPKISENKEFKPKHNKVGRPKSRPYTKMSVNVPEEYVSLIKTATNIYANGNISSYITSLIEKDIEENKEQYINLQKMLK